MTILRKLRDNFNSSQDVLSFMQVFLLITVLPILVKMVALPRLMKFLSRSSRGAGIGNKEVYKNKIVKFTDYLLARNFWIYRNTCLKRSLVLYHFLHPVVPELGICFGVRVEEDAVCDNQKRLDGHCWLVRNGEVFLEKKPDLPIKYLVTYRFPEKPPARKTAGKDFADLSDENRLLMYCSKSGVTGISARELNELVSRPLNWKFIAEAARSYNIPQLLYYNLRGLPGRSLIPVALMKDFRKAYHDTVARNMYLCAELRSMLDMFSRKGLEPIVLKGAALAGVAYPDIGLRHMVDIDLLVKKDELGVADNVMTDLGYWRAHGSGSRRHKGHNFHLPAYRHSLKPVIVEVHWNISASTCDTAINKWWTRAVRKNLMGHPILVPSPEDMLIHLSLHLFNHGYENGFVLRGLCDVFETLRHYANEIDWALLQKEIAEQGIERKVHSVLHAARKVYFPLNDVFVPMSLDYADHRFLRVLESSLFVDPGNDPINPHLLRSMMINDIAGKIRYLLAGIFLSGPQMSERYPVLPFRAMSLLYYLVRPFQLLTRYGKSAVTIYRMERKGKNEQGG
jgi:hypothetical protein